MRHTRTRRFAAAFAAFAVTITACGTDGAEGDGTEEPVGEGEGEDPGEDPGEDAGAASGEIPDEPDEGVTSDAIKIGWMGDVTGPTASAQSLNLRGIEAYAAKINSEGGILGRDLEIIAKDDEYGAEAAVGHFQALVNDDRVLAINNIGGAHIQEAVTPDADRIGIPLVSLAQTIDSALESTHTFSNLSHYGDMADVAVARMIDQTGSADELRAAVIQLEVPSGDEWNAYIERELEEAGATYLGRETIPAAQVDTGTLMANIGQLIDNEGLNYIALHAAPATALVVVNALAEAGRKVPIIGITGVAGLNVFQEGDPAQLEVTEGVHSFVTYSDESPGGAEIEAFIEGEGSAFADDAAHINFTHGWVGGMILHQAIERAAESGSVTRESLHEALQGEFDTAGLTCPVDWTDQNHSPCAAPFGSEDGEHMQIVGSFDEWAEHIDGEYGFGG